MPSYFTFTVSSFVLPYLSIYSGGLVLLPSVHRPISPIRPPPFFFLFPFRIFLLFASFRILTPHPMGSFVFAREEV